MGLETPEQTTEYQWQYPDRNLGREAAYLQKILEQRKIYQRYGLEQKQGEQGFSYYHINRSCPTEVLLEKIWALIECSEYAHRHQLTYTEYLRRFLLTRWIMGD